MKRASSAPFGIVVICALIAASPASATVIPVTSTSEVGGCTLRLAIYDANHDANAPGATCPVGSGTDQITLGAGTYYLSVSGSAEDDDASGDLDVNSNLSITGQGAGQTTIRWAPSVTDPNRDRIFDVHSIDSNPITVTISGVEITEGRIPSAPDPAPFTGTVPGEGAGIRVINGAGGGGSATLNLDHSVLQSNIATNGSSLGYGGGLAVDTGASATLDHDLIGNTSFSASPSGNFGILGGGILNLGTVSLDKTTVSGNLSSGGGGIYNLGSLSAVNSTVSANQATGNSPSTDGGGGIYSTGILNLSNVTVGENHTTISGGAGVQIQSGTATLKNSILADSFDAGSTPIPDCSGTITSGGHNVIEMNSCLIGGAAGNVTGSDPALGPLQDNGGSLLTQLPGPGSVAVNLVPPADCSDIASTPLTDDERGLARPQPAAGDCDAGAIERDVTPPDTTIMSGPSGPINDPTPTFAFTSSEPNSTFECKVDAASFTSCTSPKTLAHLNDGTHTFSVRAVDQDGNPDLTPATHTVIVKTASVAVSGSNLLVSAAAGARDNLAITKPSGTIIRITDLPSGTYTGSGVHTGAGCTRVGDYTANCSAAGVSTIVILSADMPDKITSSTAMKTSLNGGGSSDVLLGGPGPDTLIGGPAADVMKGMNGNDVLQARDGVSDTAINCDGGTTPGANDSADMDKLPKDAKVTGCEHQTRH